MNMACWHVGSPSNEPVRNDDAPQAYWYFPVMAYFPRSTHAYYTGLVAGQHVVVAGTDVYTGAFESTLLLFESSAFSTPKSQAIYTAQERAFARLSVGAPGLQVQVPWATCDILQS